MAIDLSKIQDDDLFAATLPGGTNTTYKVTGAQIKVLLDPPMPWEGHDGGIWHIKNHNDLLSLTGGPFTAWDIDGTNEREIYDVPAGEELVFVTTDPDCWYLFGDNRWKTWEFGELTNTSKVTSMRELFSDCWEFNADIGGWNTSNVTDMSRMFSEAQAFNQNIGGWDVSNVTDMGVMFYLAEAFNQDIGGWDTSSVRDKWGMEQMFVGTTSFNQDLSDWCVSKITSEPNGFDWGSGFEGQTAKQPCWGHCPRGEDGSPPMPWEGHDGGIWHIKNVQNAPLQLNSYLLFNPPPFKAWNVDGTNERTIREVAVGEELVFVTNENAQDLFKDNETATWEFGCLTDTSKITRMHHTFSRARAFNHNSISRLDTSNVDNMSYVFNGAHAFNGDISGWDTSNVTTLEKSFAYCYNFNQDISAWNVSNVTRMQATFYKANSFNQDISDWNTKNTTDMAIMFWEATDFNQDLSEWCVSKIPKKPTDFDLDSGFEGQTAKQPQWSTCPRGEDLTP